MKLKAGVQWMPKIFKVLSILAALWTALMLCGILVFILIKGIPNLRPSLFNPVYTSENVSLLPALVTTLGITLLSLAIAVPLGLFSAIFLVEYARQGNRFISLVRLTAETLAGIPSIVYGLFGFLLFVTAFGWGYSVLAGACTLAVMILPLIMRTTEEALKTVPANFREGSFALGAGKLRTVFRIALPAALPGILAGVILAAGRIAGETAALIYTAGTVAQLPISTKVSARTLAVHLYELWNEGMNTGPAYGTAVVLLVMVTGINTFSVFLGRKIAGCRLSEKAG
ncbi:MAG: phosphate ABC transporter permease PstA [Spirochaetaceae bacterium]|nr:phosphate ABC transporter permease PstA [Spirochaetaceae bacterium]